MFQGATTLLCPGDSTYSAAARRGSVTPGRSWGPTPASSGIEGRPTPPVKLTNKLFISKNVIGSHSCPRRDRPWSIDNVQVPITIARSMMAAHPRGALNRPGAWLCSACRALVFLRASQSTPGTARRPAPADRHVPSPRPGPLVPESSLSAPFRVALPGVSDRIGDRRPRRFLSGFSSPFNEFGQARIANAWHCGPPELVARSSFRSRPMPCPHGCVVRSPPRCGPP
jgi:hypothetical protein